jgi:tRNA (adenine22-N1)-methyltransferase
MSFNQRVRSIAEYVDYTEELIDIGADHAYLPIYCIKEGIAAKAVITDISEGPLAAASKNIRRYGMQDHISVVRCSGFDDISVGDGSFIVISGMGGELMTELIKKAGGKLMKGNTILLQPMTARETVKKYLNGSGYEILRDTCFMYRKKPYLIIKCRYTGVIRHINEGAGTELYVPSIYTAKEAPAVRSYVGQILARQRDILRGYIAQGSSMAEEQSKLIRGIEKSYEDIRIVQDT